MKLQTQARYSAPSEVVIKAFTDEAFHRAKMDQLGIEFEILASDASGDSYRLQAKRLVPINASGIVAKIMPKTSEVVNDETWNRSDKSGRVVVETKGVPLDMSCTAQMKDDGDGCVIDYNWEIKAKIPLGGGALEKFVAGDVGNRAEEERKVGESLLDSYR